MAAEEYQRMRELKAGKLRFRAAKKAEIREMRLVG